LIADAVQLAPNVSAIRSNEQLIHRARALRKFKQAIFDPDLDVHPIGSGGRPLIHVCEIAGDPSGGTEHRAIELSKRLSNAADIVLWTQNPSVPSIFTSRHPITQLDESRGHYPQGGTLFVCGSYVRVGAWFQQASFRRVVVLYNVVDPIGISTLLAQVCIPGKPKVEILFASEWMKSVTGLPGRFEPSPIDTDLFAPGVPARVEPARFVVGRLSRDDPVKFHPGAAGFFRTLASQGCEVKLMGATPILPALGGANGITVLPQNSAPAVDFLRTLDCFTYRTHPSWTEAWGRVVTEAMSVGIPVVAHADGGCADNPAWRERLFFSPGFASAGAGRPTAPITVVAKGRRCARAPHHSRPLRDERIRTFRPLLSPVRPATRLIGVSN
jgi:glycosyltransferase involved in cell wall biosynthesis